MPKRGISQFSVKNLFRSTEKLRRGTPLCFRKLLVSKNVRDKRAGRVSRLSVGIVLSHSTETFRRGTFLRCVSENFWWRKSLRVKRGGAGEGGSNKISRRKFLCLTVTKLYGKIQYGDKTTAKDPSNHIFLYYIKGGHRKSNEILTKH